MLKNLVSYTVRAFTIALGTLGVLVILCTDSSASIFRESQTSLPSFRVTSLHQWVVDRMAMWAPPGYAYIKEAKETAEDGRRRYEDIANDLMSVTYDPAERSIFQGENGRAMTTALLTSIAFYESGYRKDVDTGIGPKAQGDSGRSWCLMQIKMGLPEKDGRTKLRVVLGPNGGLRFVSRAYEAGSAPAYESAWGGEDLVRDRTKCFRVAMRLARLSFGACSKMDVKDRLSMYASGRCESGQEASRRRVSRAQEWLWKSRPPLSDSHAMDLLYSDPMTSPGEDGAGLPPGMLSGIVPTWFT